MDELGNVLVHQKDKIRAFIIDGNYEQAITLLNFVEELWSVSGYGYKLREIREFLGNTIRDQIRDAGRRGRSSKHC